MFWYFSDEVRLSLERQSTDDLLNQEKWLTTLNWCFNGAKLCIEFDIIIEDRIYSARLTYPDLFPAVPPTVEPISNENSHWSMHQYASGELCLEWGPDNWMIDITGANMIRSLYKLLITEKGSEVQLPAEVPTRHRESVGQIHRGKLFRFLYHDEIRKQFENMPVNVITPITFCAKGKGSYFILNLDAIDINPSQWVNSVLPKSIHKYSTIYNGLFITLDKINLENKNYNVDQFFKAMDTISVDKEQIELFLDNDEKFWSLITFLDSNNNILMFVVSNGENGKDISPVSIVSIFPKTNTRHTNSIELLNTKCVGIVGAGSLGSKIAASFVRSGIGEFVLIDDDVFLPENISRNELDWADVGSHKVDALMERCKLISPDLKCDSRRIKISGQESNRSVASAISALAKCDLIIDATADPRTFNVLAFVAHNTQTPMCWGQIYAGGIGGFIARYRPGNDPDPLVIRHAYNQFCSENEGDAYSQTAQDYELNLDDQILTAEDHNVMLIASHVTAFAIDILNDNEPSDFPFSLYITGFKRAWIFGEPFSTIPIDVGEPELVDNNENSILSEENKKFLIKLIEKLEK